MLMVLCLALTGCAGTEKTKDADKNDLSILLLINGTLGDKSFFDSAEAGMELIKEKYPEITTKTIEMGVDETKYAAILEENVSSKAYDIIVAGTWQLKDKVQKISDKYPEQKFILFDDNANDGEKKYDNIYSILYKQNEGGFLAGALAGLVENGEGYSFAKKTKKIGLIGGMDNKIVKDFLLGYEDGAKYVCDDVEVLTSYVGNFTDAIKAKDLANILYKEKDVDIIFNVASIAGLGIIDSAAETEHYVIGVDSDQAALLGEAKAKYILTSILKRVDTSLLRAIDKYKAGEEIFGTTEILGVKDDAIGIADNDFYKNTVSEADRAKIDEIIDEIKADKITIRSEFND